MIEKTPAFPPSASALPCRSVRACAFFGPFPLAVKLAGLLTVYDPFDPSCSVATSVTVFVAAS